MFTPSGHPAGNVDRIMLLALWTKHLQKQAQKSNSMHPVFIFAGMGRPTYPINENVAKTAMQYWQNLYVCSQQAKQLLLNNLNHSELAPHVIDEVVANHTAADYGDPYGDLAARQQLARAFSRWYKIQIQPEHILFTVGGAGALNVIFSVINKKNPTGKIITSIPCYTLYGAAGRQERFHSIDVLREPGYQLTAKTLADSIKKIDQSISAIVFCDPNNPLGLTIKKEKLIKIADVLRNVPDVPIILDEAYAEMCSDGQPHISLLQIAPDLRERIFLVRSATKALSSASERMAAIVHFNEYNMTQLVENNINLCGHAPLSLQIAFAEAMDKLDASELQLLNAFYRPQVKYIQQRLKQMKIAILDPLYQPDSSFYVLADLSILKGTVIPNAAYQALGKKNKVISTDEEIAYTLLFDQNIMIAPLSYYYADKNLGYVRITCSGGLKELSILMDRLEQSLNKARKPS